MPLEPGDKAPAFTLLDQAGNKVRLGDFKGRKVLVYFYPKAGRVLRRAVESGYADA